MEELSKKWMSVLVIHETLISGSYMLLVLGIVNLCAEQVLSRCLTNKMLDWNLMINSWFSLQLLEI